MQSAKWYLTAALSPKEVKLGDRTKGETHQLEFTEKLALRAVELAIADAVQLQNERDKYKGNAEKEAAIADEKQMEIDGLKGTIQGNEVSMEEYRDKIIELGGSFA